MSSAVAPHVNQRNTRSIFLASFIGTTIEQYDFLLFGTMAAIVFNRLFFPALDPLIGTIAAFGSFAVGFLARPIGALVCGHMGDRVGRKPILIGTLILMGVATVLIGCMPTYETIGILAPAGGFAGLLLSSAAVSAVTLLPKSDFESWGGVCLFFSVSFSSSSD
jgi:MHS family shikimate/dehydroshikimate transporter-like MFS transporter